MFPQYMITLQIYLLLKDILAKIRRYELTTVISQVYWVYRTAFVVRMQAMNILITISSLLFFNNKALLLLGQPLQKTIGWLLGTVAAILFIVYFFLIDTKILSVLEIGLVLLMGYRFVAGSVTNKRVEYGLGIVTWIGIGVLVILARAGFMTWIQCVGAFGMFLGTYFLISVHQSQTHRVHVRERVGWFLYGIGHVATSYIGYEKGEWVFLLFQVWQLLLCSVGCAYVLKANRVRATQAVLIGGGTVLSLLILVIGIIYYYN